MKAPTIQLETIKNIDAAKNSLVLFSFSGERGVLSADLSKLLPDGGKKIEQFAVQRGYKGELGDSLYVPANGSNLTLLVGLGSKKKFTADTLRQAMARGLNVVEKLRVPRISFVWPKQLPGKMQPNIAVQAAAEGVLLGAYEFDKYKTTAKDIFSAKTITFGLERTSKLVEKDLELAVKSADAVNWARDLQNDNSDDVNPETIEKAVRDLARNHMLTTTVIAGDQLKKIGLNLIHAVGRASQWAPRLVLLEYRGAAKKEPMHAIVGKGVTFDTGGVNLKPTRGGFLTEMHLDMSGAAVALATIRLASELKLKVNLVVAIPLAENAIDGNSYKPGSVIKAFDGRTVEIGNTDAEGRLILSDAVAYVAKTYQPKSIVTVATLTGSIIVALSDFMAGLFSNSEPLAKKLHAASQESGEAIWRMPLTDDYRTLIKGTKADVSNTGPPGKEADASHGAALLESFAKDADFAHIDIAGTSMLSRARGYMPSGGTGFGVRLLVSYLKDR